MVLYPEMNNLFNIVALFFIFSVNAFGQDSASIEKTSFEFKGQLSTWAHFNTDNSYPLYLGGRYIPQANYEYHLPKSNLFDFEVSANIAGDAGIHFFDSSEFNADINPYRAWGRYSNNQFEFRVGLQKINFGTAVMLRALRWFDQVDARDPLRLTAGVWGGLIRYYFLNNANIWIWGLYGNENLKGVELIKSNRQIPEFGGRIQFPVPLGEAGLSYHHRQADFSDYRLMTNSVVDIPENRAGIDAKWDLIVGVWFEGVWVHKQRALGIINNQEIITWGTDYTFSIGSGLNVVLEHMLFSNDEKAFNFSNTNNTTALSLNYPIGMFDNLSAIVYYDWNNKNMYNFLNWHKSFDRTTFYVMGYWNPKNISMPAGGYQNSYGGKGIQLMFVYNH